MTPTNVDCGAEGSSPLKKKKAEGLERGGPGIDYQVQLLMFFAYQGHQLSTQKETKFSFELSTERKEAGKFDDIIVKYRKNGVQKWNWLLLQAKYTEKDNKITTGQLLSYDNSKPFTLIKYFSSYVESKEKCEAGEKIENCAIVTNTNFECDSTTLRLNEARARKGETGNRGKSFYLKELSSDIVNPIFQTPEMKEVKYYQLNETKDIVKELKEEFEKNYRDIQKKQKKSNTDNDVLNILKDLKGDELESEVRRFLNTLLFVVDLPDRNTLREIMKKRIGEELRWLDNTIIDQFIRKMFDYTITLGKDFLTGSQIKDFFLKMRELINDIVLRPSYYLKIQNTKIDFVDNKIEKIKNSFNDFLSTQNAKKILLLKTDSMLLSAIKLNQILKELSLTKYSYYNKHNFLNFKELIEINNLQNEIIRSLKEKDGSHLWMFVCDDWNVNAKEKKNLQSKLCNIAIENNFEETNEFKKVVFITEQDLVSSEIGMSKECFLDINDSNNFSDLTDASKRYLLDQNITFYEKSIPLKELYFKLKNEELTSSEQLKQLNIDVKTLECLVEGSIKIVKQFSTSNLEGAYSKFYEKINTDILIERLKESDDGSFIVSGIDDSEKKNAFIENLKANAKKQQIDIDQDQICEKPSSCELSAQYVKKIILTDSKFEEKDFKQLCHDNADKKFYWITWKDNKFIFHSLYYPKFLKRKFKYPRKISIPDDIKVELLEKINGTIFFFTGADKLEDLFEVLQWQDETEQEKLIKNYQSGNIIIQKEDDRGEKFSKLAVDKAKDNKKVYWIHIKNDNNNSKQMIWRDVTRKSVSEENLRDMISDKSSIIIDKPGMGKSTALTILSEKMLESYWVMLITLRDWQEVILSLPEDIKDTDSNVVVKFLSDTKNLRTPLEKNIVKHILDKNDESGVKLLLLFDGFDEIRKYDTENVGKRKLEGLLRFLKGSPQSIVWITAREHDAARLKTILSVFDIKFEPLHDDLQKEYFKNVWSNSLALRFSEDELYKIFSSENSKFEEYYQSLSSAAKKILENKHNDFMGIPLTLRLFAEGFRSKFMEFIDSPKENFHEDFDNFSIFKLYQYFIDQKFNIFLREKTNLSSGFTMISENWFKKLLIKLHCRLAFHELFGEEETERLLGTKEPFKKKDHFSVDSAQLSELLSFGIIRSVKEAHYEFLHRTLAECLVSEMFIYMLRYKEQNNSEKYKKIISFIKNNILKENNNVIYKFLDVRSKQDPALKEVWGLMSITDAELENILGQGTTRNVFRLKTITDDVDGSIVEENIEDLRAKVENSVSWNEARTSFGYNDVGWNDSIKKLVRKSLIETDLDQLKKILNFLLPLLNGSIFGLFNVVLTNDNMVKIFDHYILQVEEQNSLELNANFIQDFNKRLYSKISDAELRKLIAEYDQNLPAIISQIVSQKAQESAWLEEKGVNLVLASLVLTKDMARIFNSKLSTSKRFFNGLITKLLRFKYFAKHDSMAFTEIDIFALLDMFLTFAHCNESLILVETSLKGLLECISDLLLPCNISQENFTISMMSLVILKDWNFRLAYKDGSLSLHYYTEYSLLLELQHSAKIVKLLLSRLRGNSASFDFEEACRDTFQSISEAMEEE